MLSPNKPRNHCFITQLEFPQIYRIYIEELIPCRLTVPGRILMKNDVSEINSTPELGGLRSMIPSDTLSQGEEVQQR